jgi:hypothetical protein
VERQRSPRRALCAAPSHLLLAAANAVLQHVVEVLRPLGDVADAITADVKVCKCLIIRATMQVLTLQDHLEYSRSEVRNAYIRPAHPNYRDLRSDTQDNPAAPWVRAVGVALKTALPKPRQRKTSHLCAIA